MRSIRRNIAFPFVLLSLAVLPTLLAAGPVQEVASIGLTVGDLDRSVDFFTQVLSFEKSGESEISGSEVERLYGVFGMRARVATLRLGGEQIELMQFLAPEGRPMPGDSRGNDLWFQHIAIVVSDMDKAYQQLRKHKVRHASTGPQTLPSWNENAGGIKAFYFKDPDGHFLELIWFPPGKGDPRWQMPADRLFLGIDHTAITVADTDTSLAFWRDRLGFLVAGGSENYGTEQEHLNNIFGARLKITALRAPHGPGVELLEYLAPGTGRPYPADTGFNDLWNWHVRLGVKDSKTLHGQWLRDGRSGVSAEPIDGAGPPYHQAWTVRDPDGHAVVGAETADPSK